MLNSNLLKEKLIKIKENNYVINDSVNVFEMALDMLQHIGSTDSEFRDRLIYSTLSKWTISVAFTSEQMHELLRISLDEAHLFYKIGERDTDSVFTRTFSVLIIPLALYLDNSIKFLSKEEIIDIKEKVIKYLELENDVRGFVEGKGWAHSTAHAADALEDIARSEYINHDELLEILDVIKMKICISNYTYINEEDERMVIAAMSVFNRRLLEDEEVIKWIKSFGSIEKTVQHLIVNTKHFLRSLYFKTLYQKKFEMITEAILYTLQDL
jgi:hypothetical protein